MTNVKDDVKLTEDLRTEWNGVGDAELVTDAEALVQSISVSALQSYVNSNGSLTATAIEEMRGDIETAIINNQNTRSPIDVTVDEIDWGESTVVFAISTNRVSLTEVASV